MESAVELEVVARLADRERELEARRWTRELRRARRERRVESRDERQRTGWWGVPSVVWWLTLPGRFGSP